MAKEIERKAERLMGLRKGWTISLGLLVMVGLLATACGGVAMPQEPPPGPAPTATRVPEATPPRDLPPDGATIRFDRYSVEEGLSMSAGNSILQDSRGFLWIGTEDGLNRFDGYNFRVYRNDPEDANSLGNNYISAIHEGPPGVLWIGTYGGGLDRYDLETGQFSHYRHNSEDPSSLSEDYILSLDGEEEGILWIGTRGGGLDRFDPAAGSWRHFRFSASDPNTLSNDYVTAIGQDASGTLWVGTSIGLNRFDPETETFTRYRYDPGDPHSLSGNAVAAIHGSRSGELWIGMAAGGLNRVIQPGPSDSEGPAPSDAEGPAGRQVAFVSYRHDPEDPYSLSSDEVQAIVEDASGVLWVGTAAGLDRLDPGSVPKEGRQRFVHYQNDPGDPHSLSTNAVRSLYEDQSGGLWIGTYGGGIHRYDRQREPFVHYRPDPDDANSLSEKGVWAIYEDQAGVLWIGTDGGGLNRFDRETGQWRHYQHDPDDTHSLSDDVVVSVYQDRWGTLWIGTWGGGLNRFDPETEQFTHYRFDPADPHSLSNNVVWKIYEDRHGVLWVGTSFGLNRLDWEGIPGSDKVQFTRYLNEPGDPFSLSDNNVGSIYEDRTGVLWFGTHKGLNRFDRETEQFTSYQHDPQDPQSISHNIVFSIYEDRARTLWLGTWGGGLNRFDRQTGTFSHYRVKDGLPNDVVYGILEEDVLYGIMPGDLWLSTNRGLSWFDPRTETFKNYDARDGLQSNEFSFNAYLKSVRGEMFFGGINGFNAFYPDRVRDNAYVPPIVLTSLTQGGEPVELGGAVGEVSDTTIRWPYNDFEFEFASLSYYQPEDNQYAYMLEGYDRGWNYTGNRRYSGYTNLPGGSYTLRLKGSNNDGLWNEAGTAMSITIVPPPWATWWFRGLIVLGLVVLVVGAYRLRLRSVESRSHELEKQVADRTRELAALNAVAAVVSRSLDLQTIMDDALDTTLALMETEAGGIYLLEEGGPGGERGVLKIAAHKGLSARHIERTDNLMVGEGFSGRVVRDNEPMVVQEPGDDPRLARPAVVESGFRSMAIAPVVSRAKVLGTLFAMTRDPAEFLQEDVELLTAIGGQLGVAIENARHLEGEQRRAEQFQVMAEVGRRLTLILDVDEVLRQVTKLVQQAFGYYHVAIGLVEGDEVVYRVGAGSLWDDPQFGLVPARLKVGEEGISGWVAARGEPLLVPDVSQDPRYVWMEGSETRSELAVPIAVKGQVIGVLDAQGDRPNAFDDTDVAVLESVAHQAGAAIENARLYEQAQQAAVMEERSRLARELHDAVTQTLFSASLIAEAVPASWEMDPEEGRQLLTELRQLTRGALAEMRTLLLELRPAALIDASLADLLHQLAEALTGRLGLPVIVTVEGECRLPPEVHVALYRIAQEALNNVVKHARASRVAVEIYGSLPQGGRAKGGRVELCICDDGRGFDADHVPPNHLGLGIMRERAEAIGARLDIQSEIGRGTEVRVVWTEDGGRKTEDEGR